MNRPPANQEPPAPVQTPKAPPPQAALINDADAISDPLVQTVLEVFEGEIKRVHPKNT